LGWGGVGWGGVECGMAGSEQLGWWDVRQWEVDGKSLLLRLGYLEKSFTRCIQKPGIRGHRKQQPGLMLTLTWALCKCNVHALLPPCSSHPAPPTLPPQVPVLANDWMIHPLQVVEVKQAGGAGVLGIIHQVNGKGTPVLSSFTAAIGLDCPVEVGGHEGSWPGMARAGVTEEESGLGTAACGVGARVARGECLLTVLTV